MFTNPVTFKKSKGGEINVIYGNINNVPLYIVL